MTPRTPQEYLSVVFFGFAHRLGCGAQSREPCQSPLKRAKLLMFEQLPCRNMRQTDRKLSNIDRNMRQTDRNTKAPNLYIVLYLSIYLFKEEEERRREGVKTRDRNKTGTQIAVTENETVMTGFSVNIGHTFIYKKQTLGSIRHQLTERQVCFPPTLFFIGEKSCRH